MTKTRETEEKLYAFFLIQKCKLLFPESIYILEVKTIRYTLIMEPPALLQPKVLYVIPQFVASSVMEKNTNVNKLKNKDRRCTDQRENTDLKKTFSFLNKSNL